MTRSKAVDPTLEEYEQQADSAAESYRERDETQDASVPAFFKHLFARLSAGLENARALELGCGTGRNFWMFENVKTLTAVDISSASLDQAKEPYRAEEVDIAEIEYVHGDIFDESLWPDQYDIIVSVGVFGHVAPTPNSILAAMRRHLVPGGRLLLTYKLNREPRLRSVAKLVYCRVQQAIGDEKARLDYGHHARIVRHAVRDESGFLNRLRHSGFNCERSWCHPTKPDWRALIATVDGASD